MSFYLSIAFTGLMLLSPARAASPEDAMAVIQRLQTLKDPHDILGVERGASPKEVSSARKRLIVLLHPDRNGGDELFTKITARVNGAADYLMDPKAKSYEGRFWSKTPDTNTFTRTASAPSQDRADLFRFKRQMEDVTLTKMYGPTWRDYLYETVGPDWEAQMERRYGPSWSLLDDESKLMKGFRKWRMMSTRGEQAEVKFRAAREEWTQQNDKPWTDSFNGPACEKAMNALMSGDKLFKASAALVALSGTALLANQMLFRPIDDDRQREEDARILATVANLKTVPSNDKIRSLMNSMKTDREKYELYARIRLQFPQQTFPTAAEILR